MSYMHPDDMDYSTETLENAIGRYEAEELQRSEDRIAHQHYLEEAEICRNCRHWTRLTSGYPSEHKNSAGEALFGTCASIGTDINWCTSGTDARDWLMQRSELASGVLVESGSPRRDPRDTARMHPGEEFSCRHFMRRREEPRVVWGDEQCPF